MGRRDPEWQMEQLDFNDPNQRRLLAVLLLLGWERCAY